MNSLKKIGLFTLIILQSSFLLAAKKPAWVTGPDARFPDSTYATGVGVGGDLDGARNNARAELSRSFQARIQQVMSDTQSEKFNSVGGKSATSQAQEGQVHTQVWTDSLLEGVKIPETWYDKKNKKYYAIAVLNKAQARADLSMQVTEKEQAVQTLIIQSKKIPSPMDRARVLAMAAKAAEERDALAQRRRVVDPAAIPEIGDSATTQNVRQQLSETLSHIQFVVDAPGGEEGSLKEAVSGRITNLGFRVIDDEKASTPDNPVIKVKCRLKVSPVDRGNPKWKFYQWKGQFVMSQGGKNGAVISSSAPEGEEGHLMDDAAKAKAESAGEEALAKEAEQKISQYIFGQ